MADEVLIMSILGINKHRCKLKDLYFKTATKPYTNRCKAWQHSIHICVNKKILSL
jgi:hypothetical protein